MKRALIVTGVLAAAALLSACGFVGISTQPDAELTLKGQAAPDFELTALDGSNLKLTDLRGKAVLLNFWASWCAPCKIEMAWFVELQDKYRPRGLLIVGIAMEDDAAAAQKFASDLGVNYPIVLGTDAVGDAYAVHGLPTTYYIDPSGTVAAQHIGLVSFAEIEQHIQEALATTAAEAQ